MPTARKQKFIAHATRANAVVIEHGALRNCECWGDDVKTGRRTEFLRAVQAIEDETVVFSWIEWPDKTTRDAAMAKRDEWMRDPRMDPAKNPMPFDGQLMIYGGLVPVVMLGDLGSSPA